jgi:hypothetical protein
MTFLRRWLYASSIASAVVLVLGVVFTTAPAFVVMVERVPLEVRRVVFAVIVMPVVVGAVYAALSTRKDQHAQES